MTNFTRTFLLPISDYTIVENWDVVGLQGTGSPISWWTTCSCQSIAPTSRWMGFLYISPATWSIPPPVPHAVLAGVRWAVCTATLGACEGPWKRC